MTDPDAVYRKITTIVFAGLLCSVFLLPDVVAVTIIVLTVSGLGLRRIERLHASRKQARPQGREQWKQGKRWW